MLSPRLHYLFACYFEKTNTEEEKQELMSLLRDEVSDEELQQIIDQAYSREKTDPSLPADVAHSILNSIFQADGKQAVPEKTPLVEMKDHSLHRRKPARWMAAAAVLLLVAGSYSWFIYRRSQGPQGAANGLSDFKKDIGPGHSGAILTLANGSTVLLDSAHNGSLTSQGGVQVVKRNGQVVYDNPGNSQEVFYNTMTTLRGRQYQLVLADGSTVWLNSASSLHYPTAFTGNKREVELTGEAYFEVKDNAALPFIVKTKSIDVHVLGTGFNLMAYEDEDAVRTTLLHGSVKVSAGNREVLVRPGQQASLGRGEDLLRISEPDMTEVLAWKEGRFRFKKTSIKAIMRQISRWYDVDVHYQGNVPDVELSGVFPRTEYVSQLLEVLEDATKIHFARTGNTITVGSIENKEDK